MLFNKYVIKVDFVKLKGKFFRCALRDIGWNLAQE